MMILAAAAAAVAVVRASRTDTRYETAMGGPDVLDGSPSVGESLETLGTPVTGASGRTAATPAAAH